MLRHWLLLCPLLFCVAFAGCEEPDDDLGDDDNSTNNDEWVSGDDVSSSESATLDGKEAFANFEVSQLDVSSVDQKLTTTLYTNLANPNFEIASNETVMFVSVQDITHPDMEDGGRCEVTLQFQRNYLQYNVETDEDEARSRQATLTVVSGGNVLATMDVVQAAPPFCRLSGNVQSTFNTLSFPFTASESTAKVRYYLSSKKLSSSEASGILYDYLGSKHEVLELSEGQTDFTLDFDGLLTNTTYYLYVRPIDGEGNFLETNHYIECTASTAAGESEQDLVMLVSANPANSFTVYIPLHSGYATGTVDWGDGTVETLDSGESYRNIFHTYSVASATEFQVRFSGNATYIDFTIPASVPTSAWQNTLLGILQWGYTGLEEIYLDDFTSLSYVAPDTEGAFRNMKHFGVDPYAGSFSGTGITEIPEGFFDYATEATSFDYTFGGCSELVSLPEGLFKNCTKVNSFQRTFSSCTSLSEVPADLFGGCPEVTTFESAFSGCSALEDIPAGLFDACTKVVSFESTFYNCTSLTSIPTGLFAHNTQVKYVGTCATRNYYYGGSGTFYGCTGLTEIPSDLFASCTELEDASYTFYGCNGLTALPADLFSACTSLKYLEYTFAYCSGLESLPASLFDNNRQLSKLKSLFESCKSLSGESPYTIISDGTKVHLYERSNYNTEFVSPSNYTWCFRYCTGLSDYDAMDGWR